jgi:UbiD family decarboxylase
LTEPGVLDDRDERRFPPDGGDRVSKDMRQFIMTVEEQFPDELMRVRRGPLDPAEGECVALLHHLMLQGKRPMAIFENVRTLKGDPWSGSVAFQLAGTWTKIGAGYGMTPETMDFVDIQRETERRVRHPIDPILVPPAEAPVKQRTLEPGEIDFFDLPAYIQNEHDARPGNLSGVIVARDPDTGRYNLSWHRQRVLDPGRMCTSINPFRHLDQIVRKYRQLGEERLPVAQVFGHHVLFGLGAAVQVGYEVENEYGIVGGMLGEPLRLVPSATWGDELLIPADAELIVEGYISTQEMAPGGKWGDYMRYYVPEHDNPVMYMTALSMRESPIFEHTWVGQYVYSDVAWCSFLRNMLVQRFPGVRAVNWAAPLTVVVQFKPVHPGDVGRLAAAVLSYGHNVKHVIVVDEDVNPFDMGEVMWAIGTRVDARRKAWIEAHLTAMHMDPSAAEANAAHEPIGGLVIDATRPVGRPFLQVAHPAREVLERIRVEDWLSPDDVRRLAVGNSTRAWASV